MNKCQILRGTGEQRQYWATRNIRKQNFDFWGTGEQANLFQGNKGTGIPPERASLNPISFFVFLFDRAIVSGCQVLAVAGISQAMGVELFIGWIPLIHNTYISTHLESIGNMYLGFFSTIK